MTDNEAMDKTEQLNPLDAAFLKVEDADPHAPIVIGALAILRGPAPGREQTRTAILERLSAVPRARAKLRTAPLDLGYPAWVDDDGFDIDRHVRRVALPRGSSEHDLLQLIADIMARPLQRDHPMWRFWIVEGLAGRRWATLFEFHHSVVDGVSAARVLAALSDRPPRRPDVPAAPTTRPAGSILGRLVGTPAQLVRTAAAVAGGVIGLLSGFVFPSATTSLNGPISSGRHYGIARAAMSDVDAVRDAFEVTLNDVALAAVTSALRNSLLRRGEETDPHAMRSLVPVSVRAGADADVANNQVSAMLPYLPVDLPDVLDQLRAVHARLTTAKQGGQSRAGHTLTSLARFVPYALAGQAVRLAAQLPQHGLVTITTNVPGPRRPMRFLGRDVLEVFPYVPIAVHVRMSIAIFSYADNLTFGITGDFDHAPDVALVGADIEAAMATMVAAARQS